MKKLESYPPEPYLRPTLKAILLIVCRTRITARKEPTEDFKNKRHFYNPWNDVVHTVKKQILRMKNLVLTLSVCFTLVFTSSETFAQPSYRFQAGSDNNSSSLSNFETLVSTPLYTGRALILNPVASVAAMATEKCRQLQFKYGQLMNSNIESITNLSLFGVIDEWLGTRYRFGGESKKGIDCSALTGLLMSCVYAVKMPRTAREQYEETERVAKEELQEGDLVFFNTRKGVRVSHVGMYLRDGYFVHAGSSQGVTISNLNEAYFSSRYIGAGRPETDANMLAGIN